MKKACGCELPGNTEELEALREVAKAASAMLKKCDDEGLILGAGRNHPGEKEGPMARRLRASLNKIPNL